MQFICQLLYCFVEQGLCAEQVTSSTVIMSKLTVSVQLAAGKEGDRQSMNGPTRRARLCLPVLHHPPDRKVMHEPTEPKCSGESASSHLESIRCLNKAGERSLLLEAASLILASQDCTPDLQVAPGTEDPTLASIILAARALSPSFNFGC